MALAVVGSAVTAARAGGRRVVRGAGLGLGAALCFGAFFVLLGEASESAGPAAVLCRARRLGRRAGDPRGAAAGGEAARPAPTSLVIAMLGALDVAANLAYAVAAAGGADASVAVLASLYPLTTVLLARALLRERLGASRLAGVVAVLGGIALISASSPARGGDVLLRAVVQRKRRLPLRLGPPRGCRSGRRSRRGRGGRRRGR